MTNINSAVLVFSSLTKTNLNQPTTCADDSLFPNFFKDFKAGLQSEAASTGSKVTVKQAAIRTYAAGDSPSFSGPLFGGASKTISGVLDETKQVNGHAVTVDDPFTFTEFQTTLGKPSSGGIWEIQHPISDLANQAAAQTNSEPVSTPIDGANARVSNLLQIHFLEIAASFSIHGKDISVIVAELDQSKPVKT